MTLRVSEELCLPSDAVTRRMAILAMSGAGKSNAAVVVAEQMHDAGMQWVAIDPKGDWWGVRADGTGDGPGIAVPVLGGLHGDIPLEAHSGKLVADLVVDERLSCVLDVSEFDTQQQMWGFLADFGTQLYRRKADVRSPMHLFLDEADQYVPQSTREGGALPRCLGVWLRVATKGRQRGIGTTLISQRSATVHKDALYMAEALFAMRTVGPKNRGDRPVIAGWFDEHALDGTSIVDLLPTLADGEAIVSSPVWLGIGQQRIKFARRRTYDSGSTPTVEDSSPVAALAAIDIATLRERLAATIERAQADDPAVLRAEIARLQRELANGAASETRVERVEVPVLTDDVAAAVLDSLDELRALPGTIDRILARSGSVLTDVGGLLYAAIKRDASVVEQADTSVPKTDAVRRAGSTPAGGTTYSKAERDILGVLHHYPAGRSATQIGVLCGRKAGAGGFNNAVSSLRTKGLVIGSSANLSLTDEGTAVAGRYAASIPAPGEERVSYWMAHPAVKKVSSAPRILRVLATAYPNSLPVTDVAERAGYVAGTGGFNNGVSRLRALDLVTGSGVLRASDDLFIGGGS